MFNPVLQGWATYYGHFYSSGLHSIWDNLNGYLVRWIRRKYKGISWHKRRARRLLAKMASDQPDLFVHWRLGYRPSGSSVGAG